MTKETAYLWSTVSTDRMWKALFFLLEIEILETSTISMCDDMN